MLLKKGFILLFLIFAFTSFVGNLSFIQAEYEKIDSPTTKNTCDAGFWDFNSDFWSCDGRTMNHNWYGPGGGKKHESFTCPENSVCMKPDNSCVGCYVENATDTPQTTPTPPGSQSTRTCESLDASLGNNKYAACLPGCDSSKGETWKSEYSCSGSLRCCSGNGTQPTNTPSTSERCKGHSDCGTNEFCISNAKGQTGSSSCVPRGVGGTGSLCEDYAAKGLPVNVVCASSSCNATTLLCDPPVDTNNSCVSYDPGYTPAQTAEVFSCDTSKPSCSGPNQKPYDITINNKCANGGVCCYDTVKYAARKIQSNGSGTNPGGGTTPPDSSTTPGSSTSPAPTSDVCSQSGKGNVDTVFSKPNGYEGSTCDHRLIGQTDPKTAKPGRVYADRYRCTKTGADGTNYVDVLVPSANKSCDSYPWIDTSVTPVCTAGLGGAVVNCANVYKDPSYTCTFDYNTSNTQNSSTLTHCCPNNKRYCAVAGTCVDATQGCYKKLSLQSACIKGNDTDCADYAAGARCIDPDSNGTFNCLYEPGKPTPTPTPGVSGNCTPGFKGTGCACASATSCGCAATHTGAPSIDDPTKYYCVPFPATNNWCDVTKSLMPVGTDPAVCKGSTPYTTPTPVSKGCPNDGNHLCVAANACQAGYGPTNDTVANTACSEWNPDTPQCYVRGASALSICAVTPTPLPTGITPTPKVPAATGCPLDNGDGRVNSCQASCDKTTSYPNPRTVGNADCAAAYGTSRGACCTSN